MKLGTENRKEMIAAAVLGLLLLLIVSYEFMPSSSTIASSAPATSPLKGIGSNVKISSARQSDPVPIIAPAAMIMSEIAARIHFPAEITFYPPCYFESITRDLRVIERKPMWGRQPSQCRLP